MSDELPDCDPTAVAYGEGYQAAIADVVEWLTKERLSDTADHYAQLITRRFGKDA